MDRCDCLLAIGCRFGELATGSYGIEPPERLIHVDIDAGGLQPQLPGGAGDRVGRPAVRRGPGRADRGLAAAGRSSAMRSRPGTARARPLAAGRRADRVTPGPPVRSAPAPLRRPTPIYATDSGNGTFLAIEQLRLNGGPGCFIAPVDFSCMGYSVPAAIGAALANPGRDVVALPGDGALLMTGLELLTAATYRARAAGVRAARRQAGPRSPSSRRSRSTARPAAELPGYSVEGLASRGRDVSSSGSSATTSSTPSSRPPSS